MGKFKEFRMESLAYTEALHMIAPPPDWGDGMGELEALAMDNNSSPWWVTMAAKLAYDDAEQRPSHQISNIRKPNKAVRKVMTR
jgi:hypothetical protein